MVHFLVYDSLVPFLLSRLYQKLLAPHCETTSRSAVLSRDLKSRANHMHLNLIKYESYYKLSLYRALNTVNKFVLWSNTFVPLKYIVLFLNVRRKLESDYM